MQAIDLAIQAYHNTDVEKIKSESCYQIARSHHAQVKNFYISNFIILNKKGDFESAFQYYYQATLHWKEFPLAQYGIGQIYIYRREYKKAIECFQLVLKEYPDNYETHKVNIK